MKSREEPSAFDNFQKFNEIRESNRQNAYENKVCRKLLNKLVPKGHEDRDYWTSRLEASSEPLAELQDFLHPFRLYSHRMQSWSINDLLKSPEKIVKVPLWQEFAIVLEKCQSENKDLVPAMIFYNSAIEQDMVIHVAAHIKPPSGHMRIVRASSSGEGAVLIDTLDGFMQILGGHA